MSEDKAALTGGAVSRPQFGGAAEYPRGPASVAGPSGPQVDATQDVPGHAGYKWGQDGTGDWRLFGPNGKQWHYHGDHGAGWSGVGEATGLDRPPGTMPSPPGAPPIGSR